MLSKYIHNKNLKQSNKNSNKNVIIRLFNNGAISKLNRSQNTSTFLMDYVYNSCELKKKALKRAENKKKTLLKRESNQIKLRYNQMYMKYIYYKIIENIEQGDY
jgi:hypothetical protein